MYLHGGGNKMNNWYRGKSEYIASLLYILQASYLQRHIQLTHIIIGEIQIVYIFV